MHPWSRLVATLIDWFCILAWLAITVAVGVSLYLSGVARPVGALASNLVAALVTVVPATVVLSLLESSPREASFGKRTRASARSRRGHRIASVISEVDSSEHPEDGRALDDWACCGVRHCPGRRISARPCLSLASDGRCLRVADHVRRLPLRGPRTHSLRPHFRHRRHPGSSSGYIVLRRSSTGALPCPWSGPRRQGCEVAALQVLRVRFTGNARIPAGPSP